MTCREIHVPFPPSNRSRKRRKSPSSCSSPPKTHGSLFIRQLKQMTSPSSSTAIVGPSSEPPLVGFEFGLSCSPSSSSMVSLNSTGGSVYKTLHFSSGNPRIEETTGVMHLFPHNSPALPVGRKPLVCVLGVPNHMTYADFCQFCASFLQHVSEMRIVRNDEMEDKYSILIRFDEQNSADGFFEYYNGRHFNSLEAEVCRILYTVDVQYIGYKGSVEYSQSSPVSSGEQPWCPVCLEKLDLDTSGTLTTICNHSFHISCISKWTDSSCPVCRYCQQQPEKSICFACQTSENLWMCVICGFVGCGRYKGGHAILHWKETQHCYSLELETQRVWDYAGDNYVHRLIQSKTDGKLVALNTPCMHANDGCGNCIDSGMNEAVLNSKVEAIINEYNDLLATQLENQKSYYETLLQDVKEETETEISVAVDNAVPGKVQKMQARLDKCITEKKFLDDLNEVLLKDQEVWKAKLRNMEVREVKSLKAKDEKIRILEEQLKHLMMSLEVGNSLGQLDISDGVQDTGESVNPKPVRNLHVDTPEAGAEANDGSR